MLHAPAQTIRNDSFRAERVGSDLHAARRPRLLLVAECVTLAHVGRLAALAERLDPRCFEVHLACDPRGHRFLAHLGLPIHSISTISSQSFQEALARGRRPYELDVLIRQADEDLALLEDVRPDVVVGDFRLSLTASARAARVPFVNITNAYWSPFARLDLPVPAHPVVELIGLPLAKLAAPVVRPLTFASYARPLNQLRRRFGLPALPADARHAYIDGDLTLFADAAELFDLAHLPSHHRFLGPLVWSVPGIAEPPGIAALAEERPLVYVTLGSSGPRQALGPVLQGLARLPVAVVVATAGAAVPEGMPRDHMLVSNLLPGEAMARRASLVVCNGGSATGYQALAVGTPVLGVASNMDQFLSMAALASTGAARCMRADRVRADDLQHVASAMLADRACAEAARRVGALFASYDPVSRFVEALRSAGFLDAAEGTGRPHASADLARRAGVVVG